MLQSSYFQVSFQFCFHTTLCTTCNWSFHAWLRKFNRYLDAWFYLLYLHPIFTIEEFLDEKLIYGYSCQLCSLIIILIITTVCRVYSYFIDLSCFCFQILTWTPLRFDIWVMSWQVIGANEREWYQHIMLEVDVRIMHKKWILMFKQLQREQDY